MLQIKVSRNGNVIGGLSYTMMSLITVSKHPFVLPTMKITCFVPAFVYFHEGFGSTDESAAVVSSPKFHLHPVTVPYVVLVVSVNWNAKSLQAPLCMKPG